MGISSIYKYVYFKKDNVFVYEENVCYRGKCHKDRKHKKRDGEANAGSLRYNSASFFCGLSNCFFKCLLNHLDLSVHWKSKKLPGSVLLITVLAQIGAGPDNVL